MSHRFRIEALTAVVLVVLLAPALVAGQQAPGAANWSPARTPWGDPDLQGVYTFSTETPLERPKALGGKAEYTAAELAELEKKQEEAARWVRAEAARSGSGLLFGAAPEGPPPDISLRPAEISLALRTGEYGRLTARTSLIIDPEDGRRPELTALGKKIRDDIAAEKKTRIYGGELTYDTWMQHDLYTRCIGRPMPRLKQSYNHGIQILQTPGQVVIHYESMRDVRVIPLDGRPHLPASLREVNGDSRGRWEGNTLVVDWTNFSEKQRFGGATRIEWRDGVITDGNGEWGGLPQGNMRLTERFTKVDANTIEYVVTIDDPIMYTRPWTIALPWKSDDPTYQNPEDIFEYACHEGNYRIMDQSLSGSRALRKRETGQ